MRRNKRSSFINEKVISYKMDEFSFLIYFDLADLQQLTNRDWSQKGFFLLLNKKKKKDRNLKDGEKLGRAPAQPCDQTTTKQKSCLFVFFLWKMSAVQNWTWLPN